MSLADAAIKKGNQKRLLRGIIGALVLGTIFLILKMVEYGNVEYTWESHAYGSIVWAIIGFHSAHVAPVALESDTLESERRWSSGRGLLTLSATST